MNAIRARLAALAASSLLAALARWGVAESTPELTTQIEGWVERTFELLLLLGYAVLHPWLQKWGNPRGAKTGETAPPSASVPSAGESR